MPRRPLKPCAAAGCHELLRGQRYCDKHQPAPRQYNRAKERERGSSTQRGYGYKWRQARRDWLMANPLCAECNRQGRITAATDVDHIIPHRGDLKLFWSRSNWQSLCHPCHSRKTAREDGGFGNDRG
ncbi:HNH endonuclease [Marinobacter nauticus]|uniref:HNH endonuclease n=1 Tax=Marinobacter nauticus TaxID=2743 RepID=UPI000EAC83B8|nr:HNH endonuclease [Marinobacter nauticus]RKR79607.1 5-methylcytosine-specific restriction protein A [Marinobacter nauticus]